MKKRERKYADVPKCLDKSGGKRRKRKGWIEKHEKKNAIHLVHERQIETKAILFHVLVPYL